MAFNVGINLIETDGKATPSIQAAPTSIGAFIIRSARGLPNVVREVTTFAQFREHFGSFTSSAYGAYAVQGFFDNGGTTAFVTRVVDAGAGANQAKASTKSYDGKVTVTAAYRGTDDPGKWGDALSFQVVNNAELAGTYDLIIRQGGVVVETWDRLNHSTAANAVGRRPAALINDPNTGSRYVRVTEDDDTNPAPTAAAPPYEPLANGADDALAGGPLTAAFNAAFARFDTESVQLVCCPESTADDVVKKGLDYCEARGDCMFIGSSEKGVDKAGSKTYGKKFQRKKAYGALYFPWIEISDPIDGTRKLIPPTGHVMGVYARIDRQRRVWKAPAGNDALVAGALDTEYDISDVDHTDLVKNGSVNAIRWIPGQGMVVDSSRTLSTDTLWLYANVRLLFNFVKTSLKYGLRWTVQEPNGEELWRKVQFNSVTPFLMGLYRLGAFGPGSPEQVFSVKCDAENNPPANIQQGIFTVEVYFYPSRPAETVIITVGQQEGAGSASES